MIENLKCPFCGTELIPQNDIENTEPIRANCINPHCTWFIWSFPWEIWQALIDGKKAQDALKEATECIENIGNTWRGDHMWTNDDIDEIRSNIENYCDSTLKKIRV